MKAILNFLVFTVIGIFSFAQPKSDSSKHLMFKGIPIDGKLTEYVAKMKKVGFKHVKTENGIAYLNGDFASYKDCMIGVSTLKQNDLVNKIAVLFPGRDSWSSLSTNYFNLKDMLSEKYGKPSEEVETFQSYTPDNDGSKMSHVKLGKCKYYVTYETEKGTIQLSIETADYSTCFVKLAYFDKINSDVLKKDALNDL